MGNFHPPFKEIANYSLHEDNNLNKAVLHAWNIVFQPETSSNFNISVTETTEIKKCLVNQHHNPARIKAEDPNSKDIFSATGKAEINKCFIGVPHKHVLAPTKHPPDPAGITAVNRSVLMIVIDGNKLFQQHGIGDKHLKKVKFKNFKGKMKTQKMMSKNKLVEYDQHVKFKKKEFQHGAMETPIDPG